MAVHELRQCLGAGVFDHLQSAPAQPLWLYLLDGHRHQSLATAMASAALARLVRTADQRLVHFNRAGQTTAPRVCHHGSKAVKHRPSRLIRTEANLTAQLSRRHPLFRGGHHPRCREPPSTGCESDRRSCPPSLTPGASTADTTITRDAGAIRNPHHRLGIQSRTHPNATTPDSREHPRHSETTPADRRSFAESPRPASERWPRFAYRRQKPSL